jgi:carbon storage regulator
MLREKTSKPGTLMLYLNRRASEAVIVNDAIEIGVVEVRGLAVRLGFSLSSDAMIQREKACLPIRDEKGAAAPTAAHALASPGGPSR